ncbi:unnamed protein product, partial [Nesidiocoris tenuis]
DLPYPNAERTMNVNGLGDESKKDTVQKMSEERLTRRILQVDDFRFTGRKEPSSRRSTTRQIRDQNLGQRLQE